MAETPDEKKARKEREKRVKARRKVVAQEAKQVTKLLKGYKKEKQLKKLSIEQLEDHKKQQKGLLFTFHSKLSSHRKMLQKHFKYSSIYYI